MLARDTAVSEARAKGSSDRMIYRISRECEMWWGKVSLKWRVFEFGLNRVWWTRKLILSMRSELSPTVLSFRCMRSRDSRPCADIRRLSTNYSRRKVISVCRIWLSSASWEEWLTLERFRGIGRKVEIDLLVFHRMLVIGFLVIDSWWVRLANSRWDCNLILRDWTDVGVKL